MAKKTSSERRVSAPNGTEVITADLDLRDFLAATAPDMPEWFKPTPPADKPIPPTPIDFLPPRLLTVAASWFRDPCFDLESLGETEEDKAALLAYSEATKRFHDRRRAYQLGAAMAALVEWRYAYADAMLARGAEGRRP